MNVPYHPQFCKLQRIYLLEIGRLIPAQPNFHTLYKREQCSPKHELFSDFVVSYDSWVYELSVHIKVSPQNHIFLLFGSHFKSVYFSGDALYIKTWKLHIRWKKEKIRDSLQEFDDVKKGQFGRKLLSLLTNNRCALHVIRYRFSILVYYFTVTSAKTWILLSIGIFSIAIIHFFFFTQDHRPVTINAVGLFSIYTHVYFWGSFSWASDPPSCLQYSIASK